MLVNPENRCQTAIRVRVDFRGQVHRLLRELVNLTAELVVAVIYEVHEGDSQRRMYIHVGGDLGDGLRLNLEDPVTLHSLSLPSILLQAPSHLLPVLHSLHQHILLEFDSLYFCSCLSRKIPGSAPQVTY